MTEIRTSPVPATHIPDKELFREDGVGKVPGSFRLSEVEEDGCQRFWYCCPCGCGSLGAFRVGNRFKPAGSPPSWNWNGSVDKPTLTPSVHHVGHWHGWLRDGVWVSA